MTRRPLLPLALALLLAACAGTPPGQPAATSAPNVKAATGTAGTPKPTARPATTAPLVTAPRLLQKPASAFSPLKGQVVIDAHYAVAAAGAKLVGTDGATLIGTDGASLIGTDGASAVSVNVGAGLIGTDGASLVGAGAGNLIGTDGASLVGTDGGSLVGAGAGNYLLAQAAEAYGIGTQLPAAAMRIEVRTMGGEKLALGADADGKPVFSILTNLKGEYTLYLPADVPGLNLLISAFLPGADDARIRYEVVRPKTAEEVRIDEDNAMAAAFFREAFASRLERLFLQYQAGAQVTGEFAGVLGSPAFARLKQAVDQVGLSTLPLKERRRRALATSDALLSNLDLDAMSNLKTGKPPMVALGEVMTRFRLRAAAKMRAEGDLAAAFPFIARANARMAEEDAALPAADRRAPYLVRKPTDLAAYVRDDILKSADRERQAEIKGVLLGVGYSEAQALDDLDTIDNVMNQLLLNAGLVLAADEDATEDGPVGRAVKVMLGS